MIWNRMFGPMGWSYWILISCQHCDFRSRRCGRASCARMSAILFVLSLIVNIGHVV